MFIENGLGFIVHASALKRTAPRRAAQARRAAVAAWVVLLDIHRY